SAEPCRRRDRTGDLSESGGHKSTAWWRGSQSKESSITGVVGARASSRKSKCAHCSDALCQLDYSLQLCFASAGNPLPKAAFHRYYPIWHPPNTKTRNLEHYSR